jgi:predicted transcriptional regulator
MSELVRLSIRIDRNLADRIAQRAREANCSKSALVNAAIANYFKILEMEKRMNRLSKARTRSA